ncbi:septum formation family protein [Streptomyces sp. NPDC051243]|uniref:septum formation family protein n=1 Tax=Streptomyces sp. NPDC051243 TaxID=3365646 RepID=UPI0037AF3E8A
MFGLLLAVLLLVGGGMGAGVALPNGSDVEVAKADPVLPYGDEVGLTRELKPGDCVSASWPAERFKDLPKLKIVDCKNYPDGQVVYAERTTSLSDARANGQGICFGLLRDMVRKMADVQAFALIPSEAGWDNGVRDTACLLFGKTVGLYGPVGTYRHYGEEIYLENSSVGDCLDIQEQEKQDSISFFLVDCGKPHDQQVLGFVEAPEDMTFDESWDAMHELCVRQYGSYISPTRNLFAATDAEYYWDLGFRFVMCALVASDEGQKLPPGSAVRTPDD